MLCEVETAILNLGIQLPNVHKSSIVSESSNWAKEGDFTLMLVQDSGVIRLYQTFLNDWTRAFRNATATGPGTCDPFVPRPFNFNKPKRPPGSKKFNKEKQAKNNNQDKKNKNSQIRRNETSAKKHQKGSKKLPGRRKFLRERRRKLLKKNQVIKSI